ncbi:hypothetical protein RUND412_009670 [Rhizina undulata]
MMFLEHRNWKPGQVSQTMTARMPPNKNIAPPGPLVPYVLVSFPYIPGAIASNTLKMQRHLLQIELAEKYSRLTSPTDDRCNKTLQQEAPVIFVLAACRAAGDGIGVVHGKWAFEFMM